MASYKLIRVNWDSRSTCMYLNIIRETSPKDILGTPDWRKGVTSLTWPKKTMGFWDHKGMVIWYLVCTLRSDKHPTVLGPQLSSVHCCFHSPLNLHFPVCLLTHRDLNLPFLHWHGPSPSPEAAMNSAALLSTLNLPQLWQELLTCWLGFIILPYITCFNFSQTTSGTSWTLL